MIQRLQSLPLLIGLSRGELLDVLERMDIDLCTQPAGTMLAEQGQRVDRLVYVLNGVVSVRQSLAPAPIHVAQQLVAPEGGALLLEPQRLWGRHQQFQHSYTLDTEATVCTLRKRQLMQLCAQYDTVLTNALSLLATISQRTAALTTQPLPADTLSRLRWLVARLMLPHATQLTLLATMETLAARLADTRLNISNALHTLQCQGQASLSRAAISFSADFLSACSPATAKMM